MIVCFCSLEKSLVQEELAATYCSELLIFSTKAA